MKPPLTIGFNTPFYEAIAAAKLRGVVLPDVYYGELQGLARQLAFSIAGVASLDQLQAVNDSLSDYMAKGGSFNSWKKQSPQLNLELPAHRLDNIWRTNLQGNYMRGKWEQFQRNADTRPYLLYDAINDSRVRPAHLAHDGTIRPVTDAFWRTHSPPLGYRCRCSLISLTEEQAQARSRPNPDGEGTGIYKTPQLEGGIPAEPDKGWDYNPFEDRMQWAEKALERFDPKLRAVGNEMLAKAETMAAKPVFVPAATVKEAEKWMVDNDLVDACSFGKIKDVDLVNDWNRSIFEHVNEFPELRKNQLFTGSIQEQHKRRYQLKIDQAVEWYKQYYPGLSDKERIAQAKKVVKRFKTDNRWAQSWDVEGLRGVSLNEKWGTDPDKLKKSLQHSLETKWHPEACDTVKSIIDHELGHQLDLLLSLRKDQELIALYQATANIKEELSEYAKSNIAEFIAEAWAEYRNNPSPRPIAKTVGDLIRERYAAKFS